MQLAQPVEAKLHQLDGIDHLNRFNRVLVADEMGLGKTLMCLLWFLQSDCKTLIVVCPASVIGAVWRKESAAQGITPIVVRKDDDSKPVPVPLLPGEKRIIIVSYTLLAGRRAKDGQKPKPPLADYLREWSPDALFLDECQAIQDRSSRQSRGVFRLARGIKHIVGISGTPATKNPAGFFPILNLLWPGEFPAFRPYGVQYCQPTRNFYGGWDYKGAVNLDHLNARLLRCGMLRRELSKILTDITPPVWNVLPVPLSDPAEYDAALHRFIEWLEGYCPMRADRARKAEKVTQTGYLQRLATRLSFRAKLGWLKKWLDTHPDKKIAVYVSQTGAITSLRRSCIAWGIGYSSIDGSTPSKSREAEVEAFQTDPAVRVFIGQMKAAGAGIPLTACHHLALFEYPWEPATLGQVVARPRRIGQKHQVYIHALVAADTIEERQCRILQERQSTLTTILDGREGGLPIYDELLKNMKVKR